MTGSFAFDVPIAIGHDEARRRALEELAKAKYGQTPPWVDRLLDRLDDLIQRIVELYLRMSDLQRGGGLNWGFVVAAVLVLAAIGFVVWRVGLPRWRRRHGDAVVDADPTRPAADYRDLAAGSAREGDFRAAIRDRFRAIVRELELQTILDVRPARTASEVSASAGRLLPGGREDLEVAAGMFNAVVYGDHVADEAAYQRMVAIDELVTREASRADLTAEVVTP